MLVSAVQWNDSVMYIFFFIFFSIMVYHKILNTVPCAIQQDFVRFLNLFIFNWRIIALQCCVGLCHTSTWISHRYPYVPSFLNLSPSHLLPYPAPLCCHRVPDLTSLCHTANSYWLSVLYMVMHTFPYYSLNSSHPLLPPLCPQVCYLCLCLHWGYYFLMPWLFG